ncbi:hypothetical protein M5689_012780 [Euphorbia peplus]|nr:hypothetical protein M5689_012780 [Euphorbia peplus]
MRFFNPTPLDFSASPCRCSSSSSSSSSSDSSYAQWCWDSTLQGILDTAIQRIESVITGSKTAGFRRVRRWKLWLKKNKSGIGTAGEAILKKLKTF